MKPANALYGLTLKRNFSNTLTRNMRFVQFCFKSDSEKKTRLGVQKSKSEDVIDICDGQTISNSLVDYLKNYDFLQPRVKRIVSEEKIVHKANDVKLLSPITNPDKVICVGLNYKDHCDEQNKPYPEQPFFFNKFPSAIVGPYENVIHPPNTKALDWEVELGVVIGKKCRHIAVEDAYNYVFGYTITQDISARDWQTPKRNNGQWLIAKSMDTSCPVGPVIVTKDEIKDPHTLDISCSVNGVLKQKSNTKELIHRIDKLVSYLSEMFTLLPGDIILTGTPSGVGVFRNPREFLLPGDTIKSEISQIGTLINGVVEYEKSE